MMSFFKRKDFYNPKKCKQKPKNDTQVENQSQSTVVTESDFTIYHFDKVQHEQAEDYEDTLTDGTSKSLSLPDTPNTVLKDDQEHTLETDQSSFTIRKSLFSPSFKIFSKGKKIIIGGKQSRHNNDKSFYIRRNNSQNIEVEYDIDDKHILLKLRTDGDKIEPEGQQDSINSPLRYPTQFILKSHGTLDKNVTKSCHEEQDNTCRSTNNRKNNLNDLSHNTTARTLDDQNLCVSTVNKIKTVPFPPSHAELKHNRTGSKKVCKRCGVISPDTVNNHLKVAPEASISSKINDSGDRKQDHRSHKRRTKCSHHCGRFSNTRVEGNVVLTNCCSCKPLQTQEKIKKENKHSQISAAPKKEQKPQYILNLIQVDPVTKKTQAFEIIKAKNVPRLTQSQKTSTVHTKTTRKACPLAMQCIQSAACYEYKSMSKLFVPIHKDCQFKARCAENTTSESDSSTIMNTPEMVTQSYAKLSQFPCLFTSCLNKNESESSFYKLINFCCEDTKTCCMPVQMVKQCTDSVSQKQELMDNRSITFLPPKEKTIRDLCPIQTQYVTESEISDKQLKLVANVGIDIKRLKKKIKKHEYIVMPNSTPDNRRNNDTPQEEEDSCESEYILCKIRKPPKKPAAPDKAPPRGPNGKGPPCKPPQAAKPPPAKPETKEVGIQTSEEAIPEYVPCLIPYKYLLKLKCQHKQSKSSCLDNEPPSQKSNTETVCYSASKKICKKRTETKNIGVLKKSYSDNDIDCENTLNKNQTRLKYKLNDSLHKDKSKSSIGTSEIRFDIIQNVKTVYNAHSPIPTQTSDNSYSSSSISFDEKFRRCEKSAISPIDELEIYNTKDILSACSLVTKRIND